MKPATFSHATAGTIRAGHRLSPDPLWNRTSNRPDRLAVPCEVLAVRHGGRSQTGTMLTVRTVNDAERQLDAGWFLAPEPQGELFQA